MATTSKTDRIKETSRHADHQAGAMTRLHLDSLMRDEHSLFQKHKERGASCSLCKHKKNFAYFTLCTKKYNKQVNPLALCHKWEATITREGEVR